MAKKSKTSGRPSKFDPKYCEEIIAFFSGPRNKQIVKSEKITRKANGTEEVYKEYALIAEDLPTLDKFARSIKVDHDTILNWAKKENKTKYPGFIGAYNRTKELQKEFLADNALKGLHPPATFIFIAKNITDWKDKTDITTDGEKISGPVIYLPKKNE